MRLGNPHWLVSPGGVSLPPKVVGMGSTRKKQDMVGLIAERLAGNGKPSCKAGELWSAVGDPSASGKWSLTTPACVEESPARPKRTDAHVGLTPEVNGH